MPSTVKIKHQSIGLAICARLVIIIFSSHLQLSYCIQNVLRVNTSTTPIEMGRPHAITCRVHNSSSPEIWWSKGGVNITQGKGQVTLEFKELSLSDIGDYTCNAILSSGETYNLTHLLSFDVTPQISTAILEDVKRGQTTSVACNVTGYPLKESIHWTFRNKGLTNSTRVTIVTGGSSLTHRFSSIKIINVTDENNGTYICHMGNRLEKPVDLKVLSAPSIRLDVIKAVGESNIFLNWTLKDGNSPLTDLILSYKKSGKEEHSKVDVDASTTRYILKNLSSLTQYTDFEIRGTNAIGSGNDIRNENVTTLGADPKFVPSVTVKGGSTVSVTLGWENPESDVSEFYHYYNVTARSLDGHSYSNIAYENSYLFTNLEPGKNYTFQVQACSSYTLTCDDPSAEKTALTMDGKSSVPQNIKVNCIFDEKTRESSVQVSWDAPAEPRGVIKDYQVTLSGEAEYVDGFGALRNEKVSQSQKTVLSNQNNKTLFTHLPPNTNFTVSICAKTKTQCGDLGNSTCSTPVTTPGVEELSKANWSSVRSRSHPNQVYFMVTLPSISQRNGTICCFRVVVVRLQKRQTVNSLQSPNQMDKLLLTYDEVHNGSDTGGAYVAEMFNTSSLEHITNQSQKLHKIIIGDEEYAKDDKRSICHKCWPSPEADPGSSGTYRKHYNFSTADYVEKLKNHRKRHANSLSPEVSSVKDGPLDAESTYTAYLDAIILVNGKGQQKAQSPYFQPLQARLQHQKNSDDGLVTRDVAMLIIVGLIVVLLVAFMALMCVMRWRRKEPGDQEYNGLSHSIQQLCRRFRGQELIPSKTPDEPPIPKDQLVPAYQERHENADLKFQKEFEDLPDRFRDRTADASDKNSTKNRYPDIKAYDQTRVKLSTADGGSDYINANIVVGYKERKKFICAQGPMESTVQDWWRMIWEQRVHLLLMLTNIEEYSKTKCAKYWPSEGSSEYGNITVTHTSEKRYSDYLVRSLKLRLNGPDGDTVKEEREVEQYHYLVWKDYMAPEHPVGIIRFIKRFNEVYSLEKGPILVHCSAGVGRTGTLVALDSLLQQLNEENCVSIFNTICDLRHSRNYLVQSLKQYVFIYRALMEAALFGDTEVPVSELKTQIEKLKNIPEGRTVSRIQEEFEKLSQVVEDRKPFSAGSSDENRHRNRHENVIPYDRNRVILSPMPGLNKEICTYINASFIEGYDSSEQYIIAQDPLEITVGDFWRMIVEHNVRSVVMLSEVGEDKCPRYWPENKDQETSHDYIRVKYMQSQSFPYYYRREFTVTNSKAEDSCLVTQFQYNGWPVGEMAVPESTRGIVELIDTTFKHRETLDKIHGPTLIHCSAGSDRSCIFVALAILVRQMMTESRVDVFSVVRKLRSQRQGLFQNLAQYDFIYRGLQIYADLHVANGNASH